MSAVGILDFFPWKPCCGIPDSDYIYEQTTPNLYGEGGSVSSTCLWLLRFFIYMNENISHGEYQAVLWAVLRNGKINVSVKVAHFPISHAIHLSITAQVESLNWMLVMSVFVLQRKMCLNCWTQSTKRLTLRWEPASLRSTVGRSANTSLERHVFK